jgi:predicted amino acid dehydrogenase
MKQIVSISLGPGSLDYNFKAQFLNQQVRIRRIGTDSDIEKAAGLVGKWDNKADAIGLGGLKPPYDIGPDHVRQKYREKLDLLGANLQIPITTGESLRKVTHEWSLRYLEFKFGKYFTNAKVLFFSGMINYTAAKVMSEFTENLVFADPILEDGIPKFLNTIGDLERYGEGVHDILRQVPTKRLSSAIVPVQKYNAYLLRKAVQKAHVIVIPFHNFFAYLQDCTMEELGGKTIITSTAYDDRVSFLRERGVDVIIDNTPKLFKRIVGLNVLEALIIATQGDGKGGVNNDDLLEIISEQRMDPRVVYPAGRPKRINRFAFVIHPLSREYLKKDKIIARFSDVAPGAFMEAVEKVVAYAPPWVYTKITGIKSPTGVEAEGWLITIGGTPKQLLEHRPEFTYSRLLQAAKIAKRLGAQVMGLGAFTKVVGDAGVTVAKQAEIPITTGNSYSASAALWAAADAVRRMGFIEVEKGKKLQARTMVLGATGAIGSVCCRLLAKAFEDVYMVGRNMAKLLALKESILAETPDVRVHIATRPDKYLAEMDVIVTATSGAGKTVLDIMKVKPGAVITDVARPLDLSPEDVAKRPDVLVIESGEILLPGNPEMKNIGLPPQVVYACLAETIVLALEGRFEPFTLGRGIEWEKVREIYKMGLKHGMKLAAISGVDGVFTDEDIARVRDNAVEARKTWQPEQ